ncbi:MAG: alcohol dehydrogenase [Chloroflexota bacterium]
MKAVRIHEEGGPEVLRYEEVADPSPGAGEVLVRLRAASLNHLDLWLRKGLPSVPKPRILGADGAGLVEALGAGVEGFQVGQAVVINPGIERDGQILILGEHCDGTHAELVAVPATNVYPLPPGLSFEEGAAFPLVFETAYRMLVTKAGLREGEWVLVWGVGGGVASAAFQIAKALGARVIATSGSDDKLARAAELGADVTVNHRGGDVKAAVQEATQGRGADVVVEHVGEATWRTSLDVAGRGGRIVVCQRPQPSCRPPPGVVEGARHLRLDYGHQGRLRGGVRAPRLRPGQADGRLRVPAQPGASGPRAPGVGRPVRQDHPAHSRVSRGCAATPLGPGEVAGRPGLRPPGARAEAASGSRGRPSRSRG